MACFVVPAVEAVVVTVAEKIVSKREESVVKTETSAEGTVETSHTGKVSFSRKLSWLKYMLWGGVLLLAFEHVWHGEVVPWFPFLTAMSSYENAMEMFKEMATVGVTMAVLTTVVWAGICVIADAIVKRADKKAEDAVSEV